MWFWLIIVVLFLLLVIAAFSYITSEFYFSRVKDNDELFVDVKALFGLVRYRFVIPLMKFKNFSEGIEVKSEIVNESQSSLVGMATGTITKDLVIDFYERLKLALLKTVNLYGWLKQTLAKVKCTKLTWHTYVGIGDAPETAITTGVVWGLKSSLLGFMLQYFQLHTKPGVLVVPQYNRKYFATELCMVGKIRLAYVMMAFVKLLVHVWRAEDGMKAWYQILFKPKTKMKPST